MPQPSVDKEAAPAAPKPRPGALLKRQMSDTQAQRGPAPRPPAKRVRIDDAFVNPWRCEPVPYEPLPIIHHKPVYNPPCYFDENMNHLTTAEKARRIMSYHYALNMQLSIFARAQPQHAAGSGPLQTSVFNGCLEKKKTDPQTGSVFLDQENTYISRSGRHVRRRQDPSTFQLSDDDDEEQQKAAKKARVATEVKTTAALRRKKMTNEDIIARSSLFAEAPAAKSPRAQAILAKVEKADKATKKAEVQKTNFERTLQQADDDDFDMEISSTQASVDIVDSGGDNFAQRRIEALTPARRRAITSNTDSTSATATNNTDDADMKSIKPGGSSTPLAAGGKRVGKKKLTDCPICAKSFPAKEIQEHASTCGLTNEVEIESSIPNQRVEPSLY